MRTFSSALTIAAALLTFVGANDALARSAGHPGATGRPGAGTCNRCHSPQTFDGLEIVLPSQYRHDCYENTGSAFEFTTSFYAVPYSSTDATTNVDVSLILTEPPAGDEDTVGIFCPEDGPDCGTNNAGFAMEVNGAPQENGEALLSAASGESGVKQAQEGVDGESTTEVNHSAPRDFANGQVEWTLSYRTPTYRGLGLTPTSVTLYASTNACNGNFAADAGDIASTANLAVFFELPGEDDTTGPDCIEAPQCRADQELDLTVLECVCPEGTVDGDDADGNPACVPEGCACETAGGGAADAASAFALLGVFGLALRRRRRR
jgi:MYXO-CTERM domain-containing protein